MGEDKIVFSSGESSLNVSNLRRDPRLALSVVDLNDPYARYTKLPFQHSPPA